VNLVISFIVMMNTHFLMKYVFTVMMHMAMRKNTKNQDKPKAYGSVKTTV
jgi:hypothetical protein